jgi:hypothetical protein
VCVSAYSAGAYTATLYIVPYVMVNVVKGVGVHPPPTPAWANFSIMMEYTPESGRCNSAYSEVDTGSKFTAVVVDTRLTNLGKEVTTVVSLIPGDKFAAGVNDTAW